MRALSQRSSPDRTYTEHRQTSPAEAHVHSSLPWQHGDGREPLGEKLAAKVDQQESGPTRKPSLKPSKKKKSKKDKNRKKDLHQIVEPQAQDSSVPEESPAREVSPPLASRPKRRRSSSVEPSATAAAAERTESASLALTSANLQAQTDALQATDAEAPALQVPACSLALNVIARWQR